MSARVTQLMRNLKRRKAILVVLLAIVSVVALYPLKTTVVPEWRVRIVDESGAPLKSTAVREVWQHYDIESKGHRQDFITDNQGYVTFPERTVRGALAVRVIRRMITFIFPHQSSGPDAFVVILAPDYDSWSNNSALPGQPLPKEIVVKKNQ